MVASSISVLIVDDAEVDRYLLRRYLELTGLNVASREEFDGGDALEFLHHHHGEVNLIFLDIRMPRMDGFEFLEALESLRRSERLGGPAVVMVTSSTLESERKKALSFESVKGYLVKGAFDEEQLREAIEQAL